MFHTVGCIALETLNDRLVWLVLVLVNPLKTQIETVLCQTMYFVCMNQIGHCNCCHYNHFFAFQRIHQMDDGLIGNYVTHNQIPI